MATWAAHLMVVDRVLERVPGLDKHGFCIGNIAPDCNIENEDWTQFEPSREITHWMSADRKIATDCERFFKNITSKGKLRRYHSKGHTVYHQQFSQKKRSHRTRFIRWDRVSM